MDMLQRTRLQTMLSKSNNRCGFTLDGEYIDGDSGSTSTAEKTEKCDGDAHQKKDSTHVEQDDADKARYSGIQGLDGTM